MKKHSFGFTPLEVSGSKKKWTKLLTGFTLIELLIAILVFSIIATVLYSTFSTGTSVWKRTKTATQVSMNINSVLEDLARHLRSAVPYTGLEFIGESDRLYFSYLSDTITEESQYTEIYRTCYYTTISSSETGKFDLVEKKAALIEGGFNIDEVQEKRLISGLDDFKIEYAYKSPAAEEEIEWEGEWERPEDIPRCIRVSVHKGGIKLTKYISVPTGKLVSFGVE